MRSRELSRHALRRLDELVEEWGAAECDRWASRPELKQPKTGRLSVTPPRQWLTKAEVSDMQFLESSERINRAIEELTPAHRAVLVHWAWENFYNRGVIRRTERTETGVMHRVFKSNRVNVTEEALADAKLALALILPRVNVELPD